MSRNITYSVLGTWEVLSTGEIQKAAFVVKKQQFENNLLLNLRGSNVSLSKGLSSKERGNEK